MKKLIISLLLALGLQFSYAQEYVAFPTEEAQWNGLAFTYVPHMFSSITNYHYVIEGDTIINSQKYSKLYYEDVVWPSEDGYLGGIREDENQHIYFFPSVSYSSAAFYEFPDNNEEFLLYDFNNLSIGMGIDIDNHYDTTIVVGIDSIILNNEYRKVYFIQYYLNEWPQMTDIWIEGIGSPYDLFFPFIDLFPGETNWYTLCFTDSDAETYYINSPNGEDSCHYFINVGLEEIKTQVFIYPNPAEDLLKVHIDDLQGNGQLQLFNIQGQTIYTREIYTNAFDLDIVGLESGIYFLEIILGEERIIQKLVKK